MRRLVIGISGADGVCFGARLLQVLKGVPDIETHLVMTRSAERNFIIEENTPPDAIRALADVCHEPENMAASIASGSFLTEGMIVAPCSMKTLAGIVTGYAENLLLRAADVSLKEGRKMVLVPREMPLGRVHLRNLLAASELGCAIVPPMLTFYNRPQSMDELITHVIGKTLMPFGVTPKEFRAWEGVA